MDVEAWMEQAVRCATGDTSAVILAASKRNDASVPGDNYMSRVSTLSLDCRGATRCYTLNFFMKAAEETIFTSTGPFDQMKLFEIEKLMYERVLPRLELQPYRPMHYFMSNKLFLFENMKEKGFALANRLDGLNDSQLLLALKEMAKLHASFMSLRVHHQEEYEEFAELIGNRIQEQTALKDTIRRSVEGACKLLRQRGMHECERILLSIPISSFVDSCMTEPTDTFRVITHGDFWTNNLLFTEKNVCVVDFQNCSDASLVRDILLFLFSSTRFGASIIQPLQEYFGELERCCGQLNLQIPKWKEFCQYVVQRVDYGLLCGILYLGGRVMTPQLSQHLEQSLKEGFKEDQVLSLLNQGDLYYERLIDLVRCHQELKGLKERSKTLETN